jgi:hypothetical protein
LPGSPINFNIWNHSARLPAAISASAAISAVTIPAATASAAAATSGSASAPSTTAKAAATAPAASTTATFSRRPRLINNNVTTHEIVAVQTLNGALGFFVAIDLHESEPPRLPRKTVAHQGDIRRGDSRLRK